MTVGSRRLGRRAVGMVLVIGLALVAAAASARGPWRSRTLVALAGAAWLAASWVSAVVLVHQALLLVVLVLFPSGRIRRWSQGLLTAAAVPVALLLLPQPAVAVLFAVTAALAARGLRSDPAGRVFPVASASAFAGVLGGSWISSRLAPTSFDPTAALLVYEVVVLASAVEFAVASRLVVADRAGLADRLLREDRPVDLDGIAELLRSVLHDSELVIVRPGTASDLGSRRQGAQRLVVLDGDRSLAEVLHRPGVLDDAALADAVVTGVRLVALNLQRREELQARMAALRAARGRVVAATDRQRTATAGLLRAEVVEPLGRTATALRSALPGPLEPGTAEAVALVIDELGAAVDDINRLVAGVPAHPLGGGRLLAAVQEMARRSPVPTTVSGAATATADQERALFYVCSEALVNVEKHAGASRVEVRLSQDDRSVAVSVTDDGRGGALSTGSGLSGLADRLAAHGGRLRVDSPPGAGTTLTATVPR